MNNIWLGVYDTSPQGRLNQVGPHLTQIFHKVICSLSLKSEPSELFTFN